MGVIKNSTMMVSKMILLLIKKSIKKVYYDIKCIIILINLKNKGDVRRIVMIGIPEHGNLGDHAIAEAEKHFLNDYFPKWEVIEITGVQYRQNKKTISKHICNVDVIGITGGGFLGDLWMVEELMVRDIIETFPKNKIVIFPSTIYFQNSNAGREEFEISKKIIRSHNNLKICLREAVSLKVAKELVEMSKEKDLLLTPDIALYLDESNDNIPRKDILFCMRKDKERQITEDDQTNLINVALKKGRKINYTDTVVSRHIRQSRRKIELEKKFNEFRRAELVITDRLHGMIFAIITCTPCIALDNTSGKVRGVYNWVKDLDYISFANSINDVIRLMDHYLTSTAISYDKYDASDSFKELVSCIEGERIG